MKAALSFVQEPQQWTALDFRGIESVSETRPSLVAQVHIRLEKFDHVDGHHRYCILRLSQTLFGEWCLEQAKGPIGAPGGQQRRAYFAQHGEALQSFEVLRDKEVKRGFIPIPVQLGLL